MSIDRKKVKQRSFFFKGGKRKKKKKGGERRKRKREGEKSVWDLGRTKEGGGNEYYGYIWYVIGNVEMDIYCKGNNNKSCIIYKSLLIIYTYIENMNRCWRVSTQLFSTPALTLVLPPHFWACPLATLVQSTYFLTNCLISQSHR